MKALAAYLFEDLRIDHENISAMNKEVFVFLAPLYRKKIFTLFLKWIARGNCMQFSAGNGETV